MKEQTVCSVPPSINDKKIQSQLTPGLKKGVIRRGKIHILDTQGQR